MYLGKFKLGHKDNRNSHGPKYYKYLILEVYYCNLLPGRKCHNRIHIYLYLGHVSQTTDGRSDSSGSSSGNSVSTTSNSFTASLTSPDTSSTSLNGSLTTEGAIVLGVLLDFQLLGLSSQRRTVSDTKLTGDSYLLSSLSPEC